MNSGNKNVILTVISCFVIFLFLGTGLYKEWFDSRVLKPLRDVHFVVDYPEPVERKHIRLGSTYTISYKIGEYLRTHHEDSNALVLLPPNAFVKEVKFDYPIPEPVVFYYFTGIKAVWANSSNAGNATHALVFKNHDLHIISVNKQEVSDIIKSYSKYPIAL